MFKLSVNGKVVKVGGLYRAPHRAKTVPVTLNGQPAEARVTGVKDPYIYTYIQLGDLAKMVWWVGAVSEGAVILLEQVVTPATKVVELATPAAVEAAKAIVNPAPQAPVAKAPKGRGKAAPKGTM